MTEKLIAILAETFPLTEQNVDKFGTIKANGMKFSIRAFKAEGLGHVSIMRATGFFGLMKMDTLIINPTYRDLPLYSYDRIHAMGNDTLIVELYDTLLGECDLTGLQQVKSKYDDIPEHSLGSHWYDSIKLAESVAKKGKKKQTADFDKLTAQHFAAYLAAVPTNESVEPDAKCEKASVYVEGLLANGGPSTDVFKKALGEDTTAELFRKVLFGTKS